MEAALAEAAHSPRLMIHNVAKRNADVEQVVDARGTVELRLPEMHTKTRVRRETDPGDTDVLGRLGNLGRRDEGSNNVRARHRTATILELIQ
jgi:hypothetical protein